MPFDWAGPQRADGEPCFRGGRPSFCTLLQTSPADGMVAHQRTKNANNSVLRATLLYAVRTQRHECSGAFTATSSPD